MSLLEIEDLTHGFGEKEIFHHTSFRLQAGEHIGLVGANGQGKTTFLRLITKEILPDEGKIQWGPKIRFGYMDQKVEMVSYDTVRHMLMSAFQRLYEIEQKLNNGYERMGLVEGEEQQKLLRETAKLQEYLEQNEFYQIPSKVEGVATGLGIDTLLEKNPMELSGGQRTKVILAKLLLEQPEVLLLDEPTNHLDEENIEWLKQYLIHYENAFVLISHDLIFLNDVINVVYYLNNKEFSRYPGNYDKFLLLYKERENARMSQYAKQQETIRKLELYIQKNKARAATAVQAKSREKQLQKMDRIVLDRKLPIPHFDFQYGIEPTRKILEARNLVIGYETALTNPLNLTVFRGDKVVLTGANGIGKSTLMKSLLSLIPSIEGTVELGEHIQIGYYEQELDEIPQQKVLNFLWDFFPDRVNHDIRSMLARCGLRTEHIMNDFSSLSGGEQSRARLCRIVNEKTNVLFLDEPTNHLDQDAKKELKRALMEYPGTVIFVSHEREFYEGLATKVWDCRSFRIGE